MTIPQNRINSRVLVVGSSNMDLIGYTSHLPKPGETLRGSKFAMGFGGKGANQAVMAALLGAPVTMIAKVGTDIFGNNMIDNLNEKGVDVSHIIQTDLVSSGVALISVSDDGENNIVIVSGSNDLLSVEEIEMSREIFKECSILLTQLEITLESTVTALRVGKEEGVLTILNPAPAQKLSEDIFQYIDIMCLNETELELISDMPVTTMDQIKEAAQNLIHRGVKKVIVTLGDKGSLYIDKEESFHVEATKVEVKDTTGAGDCFIGSLAYFLNHGQPVSKAMEFASYIAGISVTKEGTQTSYPHKSSLPSHFFD